MDSTNLFHSRWSRLQQIWALFALVLFAVTYRLWLPENPFPRVPLLSVFTSEIVQATWIHYLMLSSGVISLLIILIKPNQRVWMLTIGSLVALFSLNQHHLQPWAFHLFLGATVFAMCSYESGIRLLRILCISIYLFSAAGKFDYQFVHTVGGQFLDALFGLFGENTKQLSAEFTATLALIFPAFELLVAVLLGIAKTRKLGIFAAILLHASIMLILSPLGLDHKPGVIIWNGLFLSLIPILFRDAVQTARKKNDLFRTRIASTIIWLASIFPILEPFGKYDHWLAWGLYSPRTSRVKVYIPLHQIARLSELEPYLSPEDGTTPFRLLEIRHWSLEELKVPIYPQDRFQLAVARYIAHHYRLESGIEVHLEGIANRFTGERKVEILRGKHEIDMRCEQFFFSTDFVGN